MKRQSNQGGYGTVLAVCVISLCIVGLASMGLHNSYRQQHAVRTSAFSVEVSSKDAVLAGNAGRDIFTQVQTAMNNGTANTGISGTLGYSTNIGAAAGVRLDVSDSGASGTKTVTATNTVGVPTMTAWSPTVSPYSLINLPAVSSVSVRGGQVVGRVFDVAFQRNINLRDNIGGVTRTFSQPKRVRVFEIPAQTAVFGRSVMLDGATAGSVLAGELSLAANATAVSVTVSRALTAAAGATVGGKQLRELTNEAASAALAKRLEAGDVTSNGPVSPQTISVIRGTDNVMFVDLGDRALGADGVPNILRRPVAPAPTAFERYVLPFYACTLRIAVTLNPARTSGAYTMTCFDAGGVAVKKTTSGTLTVGGAAVNGLRLSARGTVVSLALDPIAVASSAAVSGVGGGLPAARAVFCEVAGTGQNIITLTNARTLTTLQGFSLVSPNQVVLSGRVNTQAPVVPVSILATSVRAGWYSAGSVNFSGQVGRLSGSTPGAPTNKTRSFDGDSATGGVTVLTDIPSPARVPPVTLKSWLILSGEG